MTAAMVKILFVADIVGKPGRRAVRELLPSLVAAEDISLVVANCENAAGGFGVTREILDELLQAGIQVLTSGNHIWDKKEVVDLFLEYNSLLRPANYPAQTPGEGSILVTTRENLRVGVLNLVGRAFMSPVDCPFQAAERLLPSLKEQAQVILVDIHAEATSEKKALAYYLDGRVSAVLGTHTHVQTADETILPGGTAYISDTGMTGPHDSVIGIKKEIVIERFLTQIPHRFEVARGGIRLEGVILEIDGQTAKTLHIRRLSLPLPGAS
jgi:metallophosphoesterase (TIGR00282 family)